MLEFFYKKQINNELKDSHVAIGNLTSGEGYNRFWGCLIRGIAMFLGCFGTIYGLLSAFNLPYNFGALFVSLLICSIVFALFYVNKVIFYPGYIITMLIYTVLLAKYYIYTNSGYQAVINTIYEAYSDFFNLLSIREASELVSDRYITVTFAAIFMGIFIALLLNITISGYMNLPETILVTFPFLEIAFYIGKKPSILAIIMIISCYIYVGIMQAGKHGRGSVPGFKRHEFTRTRFRNKLHYSHQASPFFDLITMIIAISFAIILVIVSIPAYQTEISKSASNKIRKETDEYVKTFVQTGVWGLLSRYDSTGGLSSGRLGGVGSVRPDFETDLEVTFAPYSMSTVYLKSFVGNRYTHDQWFDIVYYDDNQESLSYYDTASLYEFESDRSIDESNVAKMTIKNIEAASNVYYEPYITEQSSVSTDKDEIFKEQPYNISQNNLFPIDSTLSLVFYPQIDMSYPDREDELLKDEKYYNYVYGTCLEVPESLKPTLDEFLESAEADILNSPKDLSQFNNSENAYRLFCALSVYNQFYKDYKYTMQPGSTPRSEDFVDYFLTTQHRGYCAHFASSTVLLLRELGIPARYVEGYAIQINDLEENTTAVDADYDDWYTGTNMLTEKGVLVTNVNDSQAHAWVEIYMDGYGFVPFEATIPSDGDEVQNSSFLSDIFSGIFNQINIENLENADSSSSSQNVDAVNTFFNKFNIPTSSLTKPLIIILLIFIGTIFAYILIRAIYKRIKKLVLIKRGEYNILIYDSYLTLSNKLSKRVKRNNLLPKDCKDIYCQICIEKNIEPVYANIFDQIEYALYSGKNISEAEYKEITNTLNKISKTI